MERGLGWLGKPYTMESLAETVARALEAVPASALGIDEGLPFRAATCLISHSGSGVTQDTSHPRADGRSTSSGSRVTLAARFCLLVIIGAAVAAYHNSFSGPFVFDDIPESSTTHPSGTSGQLPRSWFRR